MSPTVFREKGYRFFFFSREGTRMHVHVISGDGEAKYWLEPEIELSKQSKYSNKQLSEIKSLVEEHKDEIITAWEEPFGD
jgi:diadenosine tetraphosphate (Ap4A) HIT family hydrolase